jgi:hypothetical protein
MYTSIASSECFGDDSSDSAAGLMKMFQNPAQLDQTVRQAVQLCWTVIPKDRRTPEELEKQFRRVVERALADFAEDQAEFRQLPTDGK